MSTSQGLDRRRPLRRALHALGVLLLIAIIGSLLIDRMVFENSSDPAGTGSGVAATQARSVPPFTGIVLAGANNVTVRVGAPRSVVVHADGNLLGRVTTSVRSGNLVIGTTPGNLNARRPMFVVVGTPSLDDLVLRGAGNISATGIDSRRLTIALPGAGNVHATGTARRLEVAIGGQGTAELHRLVARDANAAIGGAGTIMLTATHRLTAGISGSGTILYGGSPSLVTKAVTGTGAITPG